MVKPSGQQAPYYVVRYVVIKHLLLTKMGQMKDTSLQEVTIRLQPYFICRGLAHQAADSGALARPMSSIMTVLRIILFCTIMLATTRRRRRKINDLCTSIRSKPIVC